MNKLDELKFEYEKVCEKLEQLNEKAFQLEQEMMFERNKMQKENVN